MTTGKAGDSLNWILEIEHAQAKANKSGIKHAVYMYRGRTVSRPLTENNELIALEIIHPIINRLRIVK